VSKNPSDKQMRLQLNDLLEVRRSDDVYSNGVSETVRLSVLLQDFNTDRILKPAHQRDLVWTEQKQREYIAAICQDSTPPGSIELYEVIGINGRPGPKYINDGVQRLFTVKGLRDSPEKYGLSLEDVDYILDNTRYPVTTKKQRSHQEAVDRFLRVNSGVALTPYQLIIGKVIYCQGDERSKAWTAFVDRIIRTVTDQIRRVTTYEKKYQSVLTQVQLNHKFNRFCLSIFWRYLSREQAPIAYKCDQSSIDESNVFENDLSRELSKIGIDLAISKSESFARMLENESALLIDLWKKTGHERERQIKVATVKWLLDLAVYRRNNDVPVEKWADFIEKLLTVGNGRSELRFSDARIPGQYRRVSLTGGRIGSLGELSGLLDSDFADSFSKRRIKRDRLEPGYHHSHKKPYSKNGEGDTFIEPALLNLSRGAQDFPG
jgi:hypothetical protein